MAVRIIYVSKKVWDETIPTVDLKKYMLLGNQTCTRKDLFNFALALGVSSGYPTELKGKSDLFRNESVETDRHLYDAVYFSEELDGNVDRIDEILSDEVVFPLVEQYAETGFARIADALREKSEETLVQELIKEMNEIYKNFISEYKNL